MGGNGLRRTPEHAILGVTVARIEIERLRGQRLPPYI
jgi:hypothetical protein